MDRDVLVLKRKRWPRGVVKLKEKKQVARKQGQCETAQCQAHFWLGQLGGGSEVTTDAKHLTLPRAVFQRIFWPQIPAMPRLRNSLPDEHKPHFYQWVFPRVELCWNYILSKSLISLFALLFDKLIIVREEILKSYK